MFWHEILSFYPENTHGRMKNYLSLCLSLCWGMECEYKVTLFPERVAIGRSMGTAGVPSFPKQDPILSFSHLFLLISACIGVWYPLSNRSSPPNGKSWNGSRLCINKETVRLLATYFGGEGWRASTNLDPFWVTLAQGSSVDSLDQTTIETYWKYLTEWTMMVWYDPSNQTAGYHWVNRAVGDRGFLIRGVTDRLEGHQPLKGLFSSKMCTKMKEVGPHWGCRGLPAAPLDLSMRTTHWPDEQSHL